MQAQQKKVFYEKVKKNKFKEVDLVMIFDIQHHCKVYKKLLPKWFEPFIIKKMLVNNGSYELENVEPHHIQIALIMPS